jgi:hypothetical protein
MTRLVALLWGLGCLRLGDAGAQTLASPPDYLEYRADAIVAHNTSLEAGLGAVEPLGPYIRMGIDGAAGASWRDGSPHPSGRIDAIGRFLLDPFREMQVGLSLGGGVSVPVVIGQPVRPYLAVVVDIEGRMKGPVTPALQLGLGGGARIGVVMRTSVRRWR